MGHIPLLLCRQLRANRNPQVLLIGVALADLQQSSGINIIFNYAEEIYHSAAMETPAFCSTSKSLGTINRVLTLLALTLVDRVWRRFLMLFECGGIALSHLVLGLSYRVGIKGLPALRITLCTIWLLRTLPLPP